MAKQKEEGRRRSEEEDCDVILSGSAPKCGQPLVALCAVIMLIASAMLAQESSTSEVFDKVETGKAWTQSPTTFRGVSFGGTEANLAAVLGPVKCNDRVDGAVKTRECRATKNECRMMVNGTPLEDFYLFHDGQLVAVRLSRQTSAFGVLLAPSYSDVLSVFTEKYGPPTTTWKTRYKGVRSVHYSMLGKPIGPYVPYETVQASAEWRNDLMLIDMREGGDGQFASGFIRTAAWERELVALNKKPTTAF